MIGIFAIVLIVILLIMLVIDVFIPEIKAFYKNVKFKEKYKEELKRKSCLTCIYNNSFRIDGVYCDKIEYTIDNIKPDITICSFYSKSDFKNSLRRIKYYNELVFKEKIKLKKEMEKKLIIKEKQKIKDQILRDIFGEEHINNN